MPDKKQSILLGAVVTAILSTSYLGFVNCLCCAGVIAGAMVAVWHYTDENELTITPGQGAVMGLLTAVIGFVVAVILDYVLIKMGVRADLVILEKVLDMFGEQMPPESYDLIVEQMEQEVTVLSHLKSQAPGVVIGAIFGAAGGAIGASVFKKGTGSPGEVDEG